MLSIRENLLETIRGGHPDRFVKQFEYQNWIGDPMMGIYMGKMQKGGQWKTGWGVTMIMPEQGPGAFPLCDNMHKVIKDVAHWRDYVEAPDIVLGDTAWEEYIAKAERVDRHEQFVTATVFNGIFEKAHFMLGLEDTMIAMYEEPEAMKELFQYLADWEILIAEEYAKYVKPDCLFHHDDWGTQKSLFMSKDMFDEFLLEPYKRVYNTWKARGVEIIVHHSDSYIGELIPSMIEMGVDIHQGILDTNNIPMLIQKYGSKISFMGGLNNGKYDKENWRKEEIRAGLSELLEQTCGMNHLIPALTMGEPGSIFKDVYGCVNELLTEEFDQKYFPS